MGLKAGALDARTVRALRPRRPEVDPWRLHGLELEEEPGWGPALTLFLAGAECPFTCVFCDLWRHTTRGPTPKGAIPRQIAAGLAEAAGARELRPGETALKLYNASNFFDERAVPEADDGEILDLVEPFGRVVVECHPRLVGARCRRWAERLDGRLEVAMGLETAHPSVLPRLGKGVTLEGFEAAAERLLAWGATLRVFVLVGVPYLDPAEQVAWAAESARWAAARGARLVSLIPVRGGNGALEALRARGDWAPPRRERIDEALLAARAAVGADGSTLVEVDPWSDASGAAGTPGA